MGTEFVTVFWRDMLKFWRFKSMLFASLIQPVLWLALFGIAMSDYFDGLMPNSGGPEGMLSVDYLTFMLAGVVAMTILFTTLYGGISIQIDKMFGLMKEMLASPMPRTHILAGITISGVFKSLLQVVIIMVFGLVLGVQVFTDYSATETLMAVGGILLFVLLFAVGLMFMSSIISMKMESHEGANAVITLLTLPLFFASNALYPIASLPTAIKAIAYANPMTHFIVGMRYFSIGPEFFSFGTEYVYTTNDLLVSLLYLAVFNVALFILALRVFQKAKVVG